jgi:hypothetical protein
MKALETCFVARCHPQTLLMPFPRQDGFCIMPPWHEKAGRAQMEHALLSG